MTRRTTRILYARVLALKSPKHDIPAQVYGLSLFLTVVPMLMAIRFAASARWSEPATFPPFNTRVGFSIPLILAAVGCVLWSAAYTSIRIQAYMGGTAALMCMFRSVETFTTYETIGSTAYTASVIWATSAVVCMMTAMIGVQYASGWHHPDHPRWRPERLDVRS